MNVVSEQQRLGAIAAAVLLITGTVYLSLNFSLAPLFIVGIPGAAAYLLWYRTSLKQPLEPAVVLPAFLATAAGFALHTVEEYVGHYGPAVWPRSLAQAGDAGPAAPRHLPPSTAAQPQRKPDPHRAAHQLLAARPHRRTAGAGRFHS